MDETGVVVAEGREHPLREPLAIGRDADNDIVLRGRTVSRHHAVLTGKQDRLLRKLALSFSLGSDVPENLRDAIGEDAVGASFSFDLELDKVNEPVALGGSG